MDLFLKIELALIAWSVLGAILMQIEDNHG